MPKSKVDYCLICDALPCECNKPAAKAPRAPRASKPKPTVDVVSPLTTTPAAPPSTAPRADILGAMKARAADATQPVVTAATVPVDHDTALKEAVKALWPILHPDERARFVPTSLADRTAAWRARIKA